MGRVVRRVVDEVDGAFGAMKYSWLERGRSVCSFGVVCSTHVRDRYHKYHTRDCRRKASVSDRGLCQIGSTTIT